jgi:hypothetical protein
MERQLYDVVVNGEIETLKEMVEKNSFSINQALFVSAYVTHYTIGMLIHNAGDIIIGQPYPLACRDSKCSV